jgi:hypothetical protein
MLGLSSERYAYVVMIIKRAQLAFTTPCARARVQFADGSDKVLTKFCGHILTTEFDDKKG